MKTRAALLVVWQRALLSGACSFDAAVAEISAGDESTTFSLGESTWDSAEALGEWMDRGWGRASLALVEPGDPRGLPGAGPWSAAALLAGEAVVTRGAVLVPEISAHGNQIEGFTTITSWSIYERSDATGPLTMDVGLSELDRVLRDMLNDAVSALAQIDVAKWSPELAEAIADIRTMRRRGDYFATALPAVYTAQARELISRARIVLRIVEAATGQPESLLDAEEGRARSRALDGLRRAARDAIVGAINFGDIDVERDGKDSTIRSSSEWA